MQIQQKIQQLKSRYSKFNTWRIVHKTASRVLFIGTVVLIALIALLIGGTLAGWDIWGFITSPTFGLLLILAILFTLFGAGFYFFKKGMW